MNADMKWLDNPEVFKVNQLEPHSDHCYYLDYSDMKKEKNPLLQSLNGQWEFAYSKNVMERPVDFYKDTFDTSGFDKIMVPGHIELAGYDKIRYINTMYPWEGKEYHRGAYSMEATGAEKGMFSEAEYNPVGSYIKYFDLQKSMCGKRIHICFEGVEEAMYLWLNGQFIGYAEDSFTPSEFDLTPYIREKGNVLAVQVHKMSTAAFLEDQDFFRLEPDVWNAEQAYALYDENYPENKYDRNYVFLLKENRALILEFKTSFPMTSEKMEVLSRLTDKIIEIQE